jgi:hypothetical protein
MSRGSLFFVRAVNVVGNASLMLAFLRGIGLGVARLWSGRYPAGKLGDAVAQMELQPAGGFHPYILHLLNYRLSQSMATLSREISLPDHNRATPKPIPLKNASISEAFPTTLTIRTKKSEP